jgi:twitching motility two-component system response regulator PilG
MLSGKDGVFDKLRGKMFGCGDYITKPFESNDLVEKVRQHTGVYSN